MIDPIQKGVDVLVLCVDGYGVPYRYGLDAILESVQLPGLRLSIAEIFAGLADIHL